MDSTSQDIKSQLNGKNSHLVDEAKKTATTAAASLMDAPLARQLTEKYEDIRTVAVDSYDSALGYVRKNPVRSAAVALGFGVIAGLILRGSRRNK